MNLILQRLKSRTYVFAILLAVLGALQGSMGILTQYLTSSQAGWATLAVSVAVAVLREITSKPLDEK